MSETEMSKPSFSARRRKSIIEIPLHRRKSSSDIEAERRKSISEMQYRRRKSMSETEISRPTLKSTLGNDEAPAPTTSEEVPTRAREQLIVAVVLFLVVLLACAVAVMLFFRHKKTVGYCIKDACIEHAKRLSATINTSYDPCVDFYAFVCSGWQKHFPEQSLQGKMNEDARIGMLEELSADIWFHGRATRLYNKCMDPQQSDILANILWLTAFMNSVNLEWPFRNPNVTKVRPLEIMINVSANYDLNFLFSLQVITNSSTGKVLLFKRHFNGVAWHDRIQKPLSPVDYARIVKEQLKALQLVEYVDYEPSLLQKLEKSFTDANNHKTQGNQSWFLIGDLDTKTSSIEHGLWLKSLNSAYSRQSLFWVTDNFAVAEDLGILKSINTLFREYSEVELSIGIAWMFIQSHVWVAIGKAGFMFLDNVEEKKKLACLEHVTARFGLLPSLGHILKAYPNEEARHEVTDFIENIRTRFNTIMQKTFWIDREIRETAVRKIENIYLNTLPPNQFFVENFRKTLYQPFPDTNKVAFMELWLNNSYVYQQLQLNKHFNNVYKKQRTYRHQAYVYTYLLNTVDTDLLAFEPPLFYRGGTFAMNYATTGTLIMREIIKSIDPAGTSIDDRGEIIHWWGKSESAEYNSRLNCDLGQEDGQAAMSVMPMIPALEVSYKAFKAAAEEEATMGGGVEDLRLRGLDDFVDEQIFFMSYCYALCGKKDDASLRRECNVPLRHSSFFVDAFQCPEGSPMNTPKKCTFFE
ncbi:neprilysin-1-like [Rhipicephalus microplus]|uniref:neprilysin-1-like n=1 Tax=Rhipicephalus microplus TaxID=6941 RepID=UPI003F6D647B